MKTKPFPPFDKQSINRYLVLFLFSIGWTVLFSTEYLFNTNHEYDGMKIVQGLVLLPIFFLPGWLILKSGGNVFLKTIPAKQIRSMLIWSGIAAGIILCFFPPSAPLFKTFHRLDIVPPKTGTVEITEIRKTDGGVISINDVSLGGTWQVAGNTFVSLPSYPGTLRYEGLFKGGLTIVLREETTTGLPVVIWDGQVISSSKESDKSSKYSINLPGFTWDSLTILKKTATIGLAVLDWIGLAGGILLVLLMMKRSGNGNSAVFYFLIFGLTAYLNIQSYSQTSPRSFGDTLDYLGRGLLVINGEHVCCQRPFVVPGVFQMLRGNSKFITDFQLVFSILSWTILAASISAITSHSALKKAAFAFVLFFSLGTSINQWNKALLSESITFSLTALLIACWMYFLKSPRWQTVAALGIITVFWNFTRYTNNYLTLMITACLVLCWIFRKTWRTSLNVALIGIYLVTSIWGLVDSKTSQGWVPSFGNVLIQRILPDEEAREYFARAGMPVHPAVDVFEKSHLAATNDWAFFRRADLQGLRTWIQEKGMSTFASFMLSHPQIAFGSFWDERDAYLSGWEPANTYVPKGYQSPVGNWLNLSDIPYSARNMILFSIVVAGFVIYFVLTRKIRDWRLWIPIFLVLSSIPLFFITFHSDTNDIERHALMSGIQLRLGLWMIILFLADVILNQKKTEI